MFFNCTSTPLVIQEYKEICDKENYCVQVYEPNSNDFSDLDEENAQEDGLNTISPHEPENEEEVLRKSLVELPGEVNMVLKESRNISPLKLSDSLPIMLDIQHIKCLEQHAYHPLMLDVQHVIDLEQYVELYDPLVLTRGEKDEDNLDLLGYVQTISAKVSNNVCPTPHPQSYSIHSCELIKPVDHLSMSPHPKMFDLAESFACTIYNLHVEIIKQIQASNEQYKFRANLHKYHDVLNVEDYFIIQIKLKWCPLKTNHKLQVSSARPFKMLQMIKSNNYIIKLQLNFDISYTFDMKDLVIYKTQQSIPNAFFETLASLSLSLAQKNILMLL
jgi:hypothetical protein